MRQRSTILLLAGSLIAGVGSAPPGAEALQPEPGLQFLTDSHGAAGVAWAMLSLAEVDRKYLEGLEQTLAWLLHVKRTDDKGRVTWLLSESAPDSHPNRKITQPGLPLPILMFFDAGEKLPRPEYRQTALAAARWLAEAGANKWKTDLGLACGWPFAFGQKNINLVSGHSHGIGKYIQVFLRAHKASPEPVFEETLKGILINLKTTAVSAGDGRLAWPAHKWPELKDKNAFITGYCFGQAGVIIPLVDLADQMPGLKLADGTRPMDLANGALRYLISQAKPQKVGCLWPWMRHSEHDRNPGLGSGVGGIGWALLQGYRWNRAAGNHEFATECMKYARAAAEYALATIDQASPEQVFKMGGGAAGFGVCGGGGGSAFFPMLLAKEIGEQDGEFAGRVRRSTGRIARLLVARATPVGGALAWPMSPQERERHQVRADAVINMALDYGQTGVTLALAEMGKYLKDDEILGAARKAGDFILANAVRTDHGWKVPRFVTVKQEQKPNPR